MKGWACDFETITSPVETRVWAWGALSMDDKTKYHKGTTIDSFMEWATQQKKLWFHNLKFDGAFIVYWLFKNGYKHATGRLEPNTFKTIISSGGKWFSLTIKTKCGNIKIGDSLKKLPFSAAQIAKAFKLPTAKGTIEYTKYRPEGYEPTKEEWEYLYNDCFIVGTALDTILTEGRDKLTIGADALDFYKEIMGKYYRYYFPSMPLVQDTQLRKSYRGGYTYCHRTGEFKKTLVLDVNSLYPYAMKMPIPIGDPMYFEGDYVQDEKYPLYIINLTADFKLKDGFVPTLQLKGHQYNGFHKPTDYVTDSKGPQNMTLTSVDYALFKKHYTVYKETVHHGWKFQSRVGLFDSYIDFWAEIKENSDGPIRELAKLMLNNLYGKLATNPNRTRKYPEMQDDKLRMVLGEEEFGEPEYIPAGSFITANARSITITAAQENIGRLIYCDTDSIHLIGHEEAKGVEVHPTKLGAWKVEHVGYRSRYLRPKTYCILDRVGNHYHLIVKCAGMPDNVKEAVNWNNFHEGESFEGKLMPKFVPGGVYLEPTTFSIERSA